jgi:hypothetical protein
VSHHTWSEPDGLLVWCIDCGAINEKGHDPECEAPGQKLFKDLDPAEKAEEEEEKQHEPDSD